MKGTAFATAILNHYLGGPSYAAPATHYLALFSTLPAGGVAGTELAGGGYARVPITNTTTAWPTAVAGAKSNGLAIVFAPATVNWAQAVAFGLFDAATGGSLIAAGPLAVAVTVAVGNVVWFPAGSLTISET